MDALGKIFHVNFLGNGHWFMSIKTSLINYYSISVDQAIYATSIVANYFDINTVRKFKRFYKTTFTSDIILTKSYKSTSDEQIEKLTREFNIHYRGCIVSFIYLLSTS